AGGHTEQDGDGQGESSQGGHDGPFFLAAILRLRASSSSSTEPDFAGRPGLAPPRRFSSDSSSSTDDAGARRGGAPVLGRSEAGPGRAALPGRGADLAGRVAPAAAGSSGPPPRSSRAPARAVGDGPRRGATGRSS